MDRRSLLFACGLALVFLGAMPLNGYVGFLISPSQFHHDAFIGTAAHLALGLIPVLSGLVLIVIGSCQKVRLLLFAVLGLVMGTAFCIFCSPTTIQAVGHSGLVGWLAITACALFLGLTVRVALNLQENWRGHGPATTRG